MTARASREALKGELPIDSRGMTSLSMVLVRGSLPLFAVSDNRPPSAREIERLKAAAIGPFPSGVPIDVRGMTHDEVISVIRDPKFWYDECLGESLSRHATGDRNPKRRRLARDIAVHLLVHAEFSPDELKGSSEDIWPIHYGEIDAEEGANGVIQLFAGAWLPQSYLEWIRNETQRVWKPWWKLW